MAAPIASFPLTESCFIELRVWFLIAVVLGEGMRMHRWVLAPLVLERERGASSTRSHQGVGYNADTFISYQAYRRISSHRSTRKHTLTHTYIHPPSSVQRLCALADFYTAFLSLAQGGGACIQFSEGFQFRPCWWYLWTVFGTADGCRSA